MRRFRLQENAKVDQVKANMENGVLTITVPKEEVKKREVKSIDISGCYCVILFPEIHSGLSIMHFGFMFDGGRLCVVGVNGRFVL